MLIHPQSSQTLMFTPISDYSLGAAEDIIETLFWLEESATSLPARGKGTRFPEYTAPGNLIHLTAMTPAKPSEAARPTYNEDDYESAGNQFLFRTSAPISALKGPKSDYLLTSDNTGIPFSVFSSYSYYLLS